MPAPTIDLTLTGADPKTADIDNLETEVNNALSALHDADTILDGRVDTLESEMDVAEADITTLQSEMDAAEGRLDTLETDMTAAETDITTLESEMDAAEGRLDALETFEVDRTLKITRDDVVRTQWTVGASFGMTMESWSVADGMMIDVFAVDQNDGHARFFNQPYVGSGFGGRAPLYWAGFQQPSVEQGANAAWLWRKITDSLITPMRPSDHSSIEMTNAATSFHIHTPADWLRAIYAATPNAFVDLSQIGISQVVHIQVQSDTLDVWCGSSNSFAGYTGTRLTITPASGAETGTHANVTITRTRTGQFLVSIENGTVATNVTALSERDYCMGYTGQSPAAQSAGEAGATGFRVQGSLSSIYTIDAAYGGSRLLKDTDASPEDTEHHWDVTGAGTPGDFGTGAMTTLNAAPQTVDIITFIHGWGDLDGVADVADTDFTPLRYQEGMGELFDYYRSASGLDDLTLPIIVVPYPGEETAKDAGAQVGIREAQLAVVAAQTHTHLGPPMYDLWGKYRDVHPIYKEQAELNRRIAMVADQILNGVDGPDIAEITGFTRDDDYNITITFNTNNLLKVGSAFNLDGPPVGFGVFDASGIATINDLVDVTNLTPFKFTWGNAQLTLTFKEALPTTVRLAYPYDLRDHKTDRIIRHDSSMIPLQHYAGGTAS